MTNKSSDFTAIFCRYGQYIPQYISLIQEHCSLSYQKTVSMIVKSLHFNFYCCKLMMLPFWSWLCHCCWECWCRLCTSAVVCIAVCLIDVFSYYRCMHVLLLLFYSSHCYCCCCYYCCSCLYPVVAATTAAFTDNTFGSQLSRHWLCLLPVLPT